MADDEEARAAKKAKVDDSNDDSSIYSDDSSISSDDERLLDDDCSVESTDSKSSVESDGESISDDAMQQAELTKMYNRMVNVSISTDSCTRTNRPPVTIATKKTVTTHARTIQQRKAQADSPKDAMPVEPTIDADAMDVEPTIDAEVETEVDASLVCGANKGTDHAVNEMFKSLVDRSNSAYASDLFQEARGKSVSQLVDQGTKPSPNDAPKFELARKLGLKPGCAVTMRSGLNCPSQLYFLFPNDVTIDQDLSRAIKYAHDNGLVEDGGFDLGAAFSDDRIDTARAWSYAKDDGTRFAAVRWETATVGIQIWNLSTGDTYRTHHDCCAKEGFDVADITDPYHVKLLNNAASMGLPKRWTVSIHGPSTNQVYRFRSPTGEEYSSKTSAFKAAGVAYEDNRGKLAALEFVYPSREETVILRTKSKSEATRTMKELNKQLEGNKLRAFSMSAYYPYSDKPNMLWNGLRIRSYDGSEFGWSEDAKAKKAKTEWLRLVRNRKAIHGPMK